MQYYITRNNQQLGPFTEAEVRAQLASGAISPQDHVWWEGQAAWVLLAQSPLMAPGSTVPAAAAPAPVSSIGRTSGLAIGSLASGILTFVFGCPALICGPLVFFCVVPGILAIVLGHLALSEIKKDPAISGHGMAVTGLIMGYFSLVMGLLYIALIVVFLSMNYKTNDLFDQIKQKIEAAQNATNSDLSTNSPDKNPPATTNNADQSTNSPDQSTNSAPATTNAPAQSTNSPASNSADSSTNAADTPTATPMNQ